MKCLGDFVLYDDGLLEPADDNIKEIKAGEFENNNDIREIDLYSITKIGERAFAGCKSLEKVSLNPNGNIIIDKEAFSGCQNLSSTCYFGNLTSIKDGAFKNCSGLKELMLSSTKEVGMEAFKGCENLDTIALPALESIGEGAFDDCNSLSVVDIPDDKKEMVKTILPEGKEKVLPLDDEFKDEELTACREERPYHKNAPIRIVSIDDKYDVGTGCDQKSSILIKEDFEDDSYIDKIKTLSISNIEEIDECLFEGSSVLEKLKLRNVSTIADKAFKGCTNLKEAELFDVTCIDREAFRECSNLERVNLNSIEKIRKFVFACCKSLQSIELGGGLEKIEDSAFRECDSLEQINLRSIETLGKHAFAFCKGLQSVELGNKLKTIEDNTFCFCNNLQEIDLQNIEVIRRLAFGSCTSLKSIDISEAYLIEDTAFANCSKLEEVKLNDKLKSIASNTFQGCKELKKINLKGVGEIGYSAFRACSALTEINLSSTFKLGQGAFAECDNLRKIIISIEEQREMIKENLIKSGLKKVEEITFEVSDE